MQPDVTQDCKDITKWKDHFPSCEHCKKVVIDNPKTFVDCCVIGAPKLRDYLVELRAPEIAKQRKTEREQWKADNPHIRTKREVDAVMRYKQ